MKLKKNKGFMTADILVYLIMGLVVFIIVLKFGGAILHLVKGSGEDFGCVLSSIINAYTKIYGSSIFKLNCPVKTIKITDADLNKLLIKDEIKYLNTELIETQKTTFENMKDEKERELALKKYNLNKIIANEMKSCWNKLGRGEMPLFSQPQFWISLNTKYENKNTISGAEKILNWAHIYVQDAPTVCVICSTIVADSGLNPKLIGSEINLDSWLTKNPVIGVLSFKFTSISYYEFLLDDVFAHTIFRPTYLYSLNSDEPLAVVFTRTNAFYLFGLTTAKGWATDIKNLLSKEDEGNKFAGVDSIALAPYSQLRKREENGQIKGMCDQIAG